MRNLKPAMRCLAAVLFVAALTMSSGLAEAAVSKGDYIGKSRSEIVESLERLGYEVGEFETERGYFEIEASIGGKRYEVHVDPETGIIAKIGKDD